MIFKSLLLPSNYSMFLSTLVLGTFKCAATVCSVHCSNEIPSKCIKNVHNLIEKSIKRSYESASQVYRVHLPRCVTTCLTKHHKIQILRLAPITYTHIHTHTRPRYALVMCTKSNKKFRYIRLRHVN